MFKKGILDLLGRMTFSKEISDKSCIKRSKIGNNKGYEPILKINF